MSDSNGAGPSSSTAADSRTGHEKLPAATTVSGSSGSYPASLDAALDAVADAVPAAESAGSAVWAGTPGCSGSVAFRRHQEQVKQSVAVL